LEVLYICRLIAERPREQDAQTQTDDELQSPWDSVSLLLGGAKQRATLDIGLMEYFESLSLASQCVAQHYVNRPASLMHLQLVLHRFISPSVM
jgi:hypothetical protein